jgi:hypothetical protein
MKKKKKKKKQKKKEKLQETSLFRSSHGMRIYLDKQDMLFSGKILKLERR